jgi:hypothetical protein
MRLLKAREALVSPLSIGEMQDTLCPKPGSQSLLRKALRLLDKKDEKDGKGQAGGF